MSYISRTNRGGGTDAEAALLSHVDTTARRAPALLAWRRVGQLPPWLPDASTSAVSLPALAPAPAPQLICRSESFQNDSRSLNFWIFPVAVRASSSRNSTRLGSL